LIFDHGLHYPPTIRDIFINETTRLLETAKDKLRLLAWRETSAQHFQTEDGDFVGKITPCGPLNQSTKGYRANAMNTVLENLNMTMIDASEPGFRSRPLSPQQELVFLPYRQYTGNLFDLHPGECTHYCSTPYIWLPVWRTLRLAFDRVAAQSLSKGR
jgi:hypothetical protein